MGKRFLKRIGAITLALSLALTPINVPSLGGTPIVAQAATQEEVMKSWDFTSSLQGWEYATGWEWDYSQAASSSIALDQDRMKVSVDYSKDVTKSWSQLAVKLWDNAGMNLDGATKVTMDFIYDSSKLSTGSFKLKLVPMDCTADVDTANAQTIAGTMKKATVTFDFTALTSSAAVNQVAINIVGVNTDYIGDLWIDNINIIKEITSTVDTSMIKSWSFDSGVEGWSYGGSGWEGSYSGGANTSVSADSGMLKVQVDYSKDAAQSWSQLAVQIWDNAGMNLEGAKTISMDFIYDESKMTMGGFKIKAWSDSGINFDVPVDTSKAVVVSGTIKKVPVTIAFDALSAPAVTKGFAICIIGSNTDYNGAVWLDNISIKKAAASNVVTSELKAWTFDSNEDGWYYGQGWEWQYDGAANSGVAYEDGTLKVAVDYSQNSGISWSQLAICSALDNLNLTGANKATLDFYFDSALLTSGGFSIKAFSNSGIDVNAAVNLAKAETVTGTIKKVPFEITFDALTATSAKDFSLCIIGNSTNYKGSLWFDNIKILSVTGDPKQDIYVNSTIAVSGSSVQVNIADGKLTTYDTLNQAQTLPLSTNITLVDKDATAATKQVYSYLEAIGKSSSVIFGHQGNSHHKAGAASLSNSDTFDVTGSYTGVIGMDTLSFVGSEYSASRFNNELADQLGVAKLPETTAGNVSAAAALTNYNIGLGSITTLSAHMPNFSLVKETGTYDNIHSYSRYDFTGYTPNTLTGDVMNQILPGGQYNTVFTAYLDMIADYANQVNGAILFRPFHECTGGWFWWGSTSCDPETYQNVFKYTVEYLRDVKDIHNMLYLYGPGSEATSTQEYAIRYPGDNYVDLVGFDMYHYNPAANDTWFQQLANELTVVGTFAKEHNKLMAVTETGVATNPPEEGDGQTALRKSGNIYKDWYQRILPLISSSDASYFLVWANFSEKDGFYTPYVKKVNPDGTLYGHEMLDGFIQFFNDPSSIFATNQKTALTQLQGVSITANPTTTTPTGYLTSPVSGSRILKATTVTAIVSGATTSDTVKFILNGKVEKTFTAQAASDGITYTATIDATTLKELGYCLGSITLTVNDVALNTIKATYNIPVPVETNQSVDDFEAYYGVDSLLVKRWNTNHAADSTISITSTSEDSRFYTGNYAMKFTYNETANGWAGTTIDKVANWSEYNALSFWTIPDGNNQKVVVQITANGKVYETYLNLYEEYKNSTKPLLVTIPFSEFAQRDTSGNPKGGLVTDRSTITSFGLWLNAIDGTPAVVNGKVSGTIYYDDIKAINTTVTKVTFQKLGGEVVTPTPTDAPTPTTAPTPTAKPTVTPTKTPDGKLADQITVTPLEKTLYVGSNTTRQVEIMVQLPASLEQVASLQDTISKDHIGGVVISYSSSNKDVARVNKKGKVTAVGVGTANITTTLNLYNGETKTVTTTITVKKPYITITAKDTQMQVGDTFTFKATAYGIDSDHFVWKTTKRSILVINSKTGKATAVKAGTDYVLVRIGNVTKMVKIEVK